MFSSQKILTILFSLVMIFIVYGFNSSSENSKSIGYDNFSLYDYNNSLHSLKEFTDKKGIVVMFISTQCPVSNAYNTRMSKIHAEYGNDFSFIGINSNKQENMQEIKKHALENNLEFVILKDSSNVIADKFSASFTPEIYVLNNNFHQVYHGRIDDSRRKDNVESRDLENALNEIKIGNEVSVADTKAFGCSIKRVNK